ncbi:RagB/SusD family nutrient uptake outer membrane protein [Proteiniphilum sp. UBA5384]|uniref:RagB/SusD family nutrient uptake outer membrane protein n=1 Tax=Proteiniphilum sp. UBA5384 TaxID=1947279 RepID=UPI0025DB9D82|nr:RagB/SusD family nutrient uptake outer membrane protein [Proteiniphilum sp. UBA5384]
MRNNILIYSLVCSLFLINVGGCKEYLDIPSESTVTEKDVFGTYFNFQGYVDQIYKLICDPLDDNVVSPNYAGETQSAGSISIAFRALSGDYVSIQGRGYFSNGSNQQGMWLQGWKAIRIANVGLANLEQLVASEEEKRKIEGQLLFFRAFFHFEILGAWGSIPYINHVLDANEITLPRFYEYKEKRDYQACTEYIVEDLIRAAELLPLVWEDPTINMGRITKMTALAYQARALLYAGSPLMNEFSGNSPVPDKEYMRRAAEVAGTAIKLAEENPSDYGLIDFNNYTSLFATTNNRVVWTKETLMGRNGWFIRSAESGGALFNNRLKYIIPDNATYGSNSQPEGITQNTVDRFEMADGTLYKIEYDQDNNLRWGYRDPRFRANVYVDRDNPVNDTKANYRLELFSGGKTMLAKQSFSQTCYVPHKFWPKGCTTKPSNAATNNLRVMTPLMRLAEVYLIYAEAQNEASGNANSKANGATLTALEAVNKVRMRAGHVPTTATGGAHGDFRTMIINERFVEFLCEAMQPWYDIRRWKTGEALNNTSVLTLDFDKDWTPASFSRRELLKRTFELRNYWLPFPQAQTQIYSDFPQNPGWE